VSRPRPAPDLAALYTDALAYELIGDEIDGLGLWPEEAALVARAVPNRRYQFAAGRACARAALAALGLWPGPLLVASQRAPDWPPGTRGSISHTEGYVVAVVRANPGDQVAIGVDAERVGRVDAHLFARLFTESERAWLTALQPGPRAEAATAVFGAKEAFYKAQFALTGAWVGFHDVQARPVAGGHLLEPHTPLEALNAVVWPCTARHVRRGPVMVSAVEVTGC
jgi:4'-phosphopantetheinyl transferase EntD